MERKEVYKLIDGERDYQNSLWNGELMTNKGIHSLEQWCVYIEDYVNEIKRSFSREPREVATLKGLNNMRKIAAMAVCAMEQNGAPPRT